MERRSSHRNGLEPLGSHRASLAALLMLAALMLFAVACGEEMAGESGEAVTPEESGTSGETSTAEGTAGEQALTPAEATVGPNEDGAMPAGGREKDPSHPPPENPPEGVKTFPATTNKNVSPPVSYDQDPPTNGDHAPIWQNCGFYSSPVQNEYVVHSLDHGAVWITYSPDLPPDQIEPLRDLAGEEYVCVTPV